MTALFRIAGVPADVIDWFAAPDGPGALRGNGFAVRSEDGDMILTATAIDYLKETQRSDDDGYIDSGQMWIGGTGYPIEAA